MQWQHDQRQSKPKIEMDPGVARYGFEAVADFKLGFRDTCETQFEQRCYPGYTKRRLTAITVIMANLPAGHPYAHRASCNLFQLAYFRRPSSVVAKEIDSDELVDILNAAVNYGCVVRMNQARFHLCRAIRVFRDSSMYQV